MPDFEDDKSAIAIPFILDRIKAHREKHGTPFFIGLNGLQGAGKTTLVNALRTTLTNPPHSLPTTTLSIDDLYLTHADQQHLASSHPHNPLIQHRGQPSTHDLPLARSLFAALKARRPASIPSYDKAAFSGAGDRAPRSEWTEVNSDGDGSVEVVLFEGWCVGFRALGDEEVEVRWREAVEREEAERRKGEWAGRLGKQRLEDVRFVNARLREYDELTDYLDAFIHIDAESPRYVYAWRQEAERKQREEKGSGMTDEQVEDFVNGYYPAYELFTDKLREGIFPGEPGKQLRMVVGKDRKLKSSEVI